MKRQPALKRAVFVTVPSEFSVNYLVDALTGKMLLWAYNANWIKGWAKEHGYRIVAEETRKSAPTVG